MRKPEGQGNRSHRHFGVTQKLLCPANPALQSVWDRIPDDISDLIIDMALDHADLSLRELAVKLTDTESCFVSEASVYRLLKAHDLITSPAYIVIKPMTSSRTKPPGRTRCGKPTSLI